MPNWVKGLPHIASPAVIKKSDCDRILYRHRPHGVPSHRLTLRHWTGVPDQTGGPPVTGNRPGRESNLYQVKTRRFRIRLSRRQLQRWCSMPQPAIGNVDREAATDLFHSLKKGKVSRLPPAVSGHKCLYFGALPLFRPGQVQIPGGSLKGVHRRLCLPVLVSVL